MPIYEYRCTDCEKVFESLVRLSDEGSYETCPFCGGKGEKLGISLFSTGNVEKSSGGCSSGGSPFG